VSGLAATDAASLTLIGVSWTAVSGATGYKVYWSSTASGTYVLNKA